jgi:protoheme IX farnesyltransferase
MKEKPQTLNNSPGATLTEQGVSKARDYYVLTKPEVNLLILMTTSAGYYLGLRGAFHISGLFQTLFGTLLVASGTATLNQWMERNWDAKMRRTAMRPLPAGRLRPREAFWFGLALSVLGGFYLAFFVNGLTSLLAVSTLASYLLVYTPLKRRTPLCTLLGALPGAMPTLIGWAGAADALNIKAGFLFAILFLWQFPHFLAIALMYREDYARAGYRMLPAFDSETRFTRGEVVAFTLVLIAATLAPAVSNPTTIYFGSLLLAGGALLYFVLGLAADASKTAAARVLHASVAYLPVALAILVLTKR